MKNKSTKYISCMKLNGLPILPPIITPEYRKELLDYQQKAIALGKRLAEARALVCRTSIEQSLAFNEPIETSKDLKVNRVPYTNLTCDIQVSQYINDEFQVIFSDQRSLTTSDSEESIEEITNVSSRRRNSYTLEAPSPFLVDKLVNNDISNTSIKPVSLPIIKKVAKIENAESKSDAIYLSSDTETELMNLSLDSSIEYQLNLQSLTKVDIQNHELYKILTDIPKDYSTKLLTLLASHETPPPNRDRWAANIIVAWSRGHLTRRLFHSAHVQRLVDTIRAALVCAVQLHGETEERIQEADVELHRRLIQQVSAACCDFHNVFFDLSVTEQMRIIRTDRSARMKLLLQLEQAKSGERPLTTHGRVMALATRRKQTTPNANRRLFPPLSTIIQSN